ncbi:ATP-binding protein [Streptosporangium sp. NBC_01639]|uniref:ATP-binding protein n=1 Tax=Streptosporangium sp. NBC_01639 TaxID=2975948 RepID=UPI003864DB04|nr:ATP-binding protein [Streptosporangium sp. NBC_01639]
MGEFMKATSPEPKLHGDVSLPSVRDSVSRARSEVRRWLGNTHPVIDDVVLATSELVTNAIMHSNARANDFIRLTVTEAEEFIGIEVNDPGSTFSGPHVRKEANAEDGRGLLIVREISLAWGVREHGCGLGRTVWCAIRTVPLPDCSSAPEPVSGQGDGRGSPAGRAPVAGEPGGPAFSVEG